MILFDASKFVKEEVCGEVFHDPGTSRYIGSLDIAGSLVQARIVCTILEKEITRPSMLAYWAHGALLSALDGDANQYWVCVKNFRRTTHAKVLN
jgi:hypothetical protein